jgi:hypothetical protein
MNIKGKFKACNLYNDTLHIIIWPKDGLITAAKLQEIEIGTDINLELN